MANIEDVTGETEILERLNKTMDSLITYRNIYQSTIETANERMTKIEKTLAEKTQSAEIQTQIDKVEEAIESLTKSLNELLEGHEKVLTQIEKERSEDLAYVRGLDNELKAHVITTDDKMKELDKSVAKMQRETDNAGKMKKAFANLLKAIME